MEKFSVGDIVTCTNIVDYTSSDKTKMRWIYLGHRYLVTGVHRSSIIVKYIRTGYSPGNYSTIFFSREIILNKNIRVL